MVNLPPLFFRVCLMLLTLAIGACVPDNVKPDDPEYAPVMPKPEPLEAPEKW